MDSDNESDGDTIELDTTYDFADDIEDDPTTTVSQNIGSVWRDMVVGEQMEGCLTRLEVTTKTGYMDMDNPNYIPVNNAYKRKRSCPPTKSNQKTENVSKDRKCDLDSSHVVKKRYSYGNGDYTKCNYKYGNSKKFVENKNNYDTKTRSRILNEICDSEEKTNDELLNELCKNLHESNTNLMLSVISKIDRKILLEKYKKTALIEANGGQMIKDGNRRRTSGGIFFSLIKEDKSIPNSLKKDLYGTSQNDELKKKKKQEKKKRHQKKLKLMIAIENEKAELLKKKEKRPPITENTPSAADLLKEQETLPPIIRPTPCTADLLKEQETLPPIIRSTQCAVDFLKKEELEILSPNYVLENEKLSD